MFGLPFREVVALDFEFIAESGAVPYPVCMVAHELVSGRKHRLWRDQFGPEPPFPVGDDVLFVAYFASAEIGCFLELGWPVPTRIFDAYVEFRNRTNGLSLPAGNGLLGALSYFGLGHITKDQKDDMRDLVMRGGPWTDQERRDILDYCESDVVCLGPLLERMVPALMARDKALGQALLRGRYMAAVARMERAGVPIDVPMFERLTSHWDMIRADLIAAVDQDYGVYEGTTFKTGLFAQYLAARGIAWPRLDGGQLALDGDTFKDMARGHPELHPLKELRHALGGMRLTRLAVGPDGRNRALLSPFRARTGRNQPSNSKFIFGPSVWMRGLIKPEEGQSLAYIDWSSQEVWLAAVLSGDQRLLESLLSGDPYLSFAKLAGLAPADATKSSHAAIRDACKIAVLGTNYGMRSRSLSFRAGISELEAASLLQRLALTYPVYTEWSRSITDSALLGGRVSTVLGWDYLAGTTSSSTMLRNFPMQGNGAEMLRLACCLATERGVQVCAPVHDALLVTGPTERIGEVVAETRRAMDEASQVVAGMVLKADVKIVSSPDRYSDPRGEVMWEKVTGLLPTVLSLVRTIAANYRKLRPNYGME